MSENNKVRRTEVSRDTAETSVKVALNLDGSGEGCIDTGIGFTDSRKILETSGWRP